MRKTAFSVCAALVGFATCHAQHEGDDAQQVETAALLAFKAGGDPDNDLASWVPESSPCSASDWMSKVSGWLGVACDGEGGRVTQLWARKLPSGGVRLTGTLRSLVPLTAVEELVLDHTAVTGDLADLVGMTQLYMLLLDFTAVTGDLADLEGLTKLTTRELELVGAPVHGDADALRRAIPGLTDCPPRPSRGACPSDDEKVWGTGDGVAFAFTACSFLPCGTTVSCVTDPSNPFGVCGVGCSTADETTLRAFTTVEDFDPTQLTAECLACFQNRGEESDKVLYQSGYDNPKTAPFPEQVAALLGFCGLGTYRLPSCHNGGSI